MNILRIIGEIGFGVLFLIGAIFNLSYTLRHGKEFYESFAANARFSRLKRESIHKLMSHLSKRERRQLMSILEKLLDEALEETGKSTRAYTNYPETVVCYLSTQQLPCLSSVLAPLRRWLP